jgi:mono/diheme cytochrome c family protein
VKKILKGLATLVAVVAIAAAGAALYIHLTGIPHYPTEKVELKVEITPERVEHGRKIASMLCAACHLDTKTGRLTGHQMPDLPPQFGVAFSRNITQHPTKGIGSWTDGEIAYLLRTGVARDGRYTPPWMVKLPHASDEEIASVIAFLRSDDPTVQAADVDNVVSQPSFFTKFLCRVAFKPFPYPKEAIAAPPRTDRVAYGRHLATNVLGCFACHSADFSTNDDRNPERSKGLFGGGNTMVDYNGKAIKTANITPDMETGIGSWTEDQFVRAVKGGFRPDNRPLRYPMEPFVELDDEEVRAMYAYLKTVPPIHNAVARVQNEPIVASASEGKKIYYKYSCQSCHGDSGSGLCNLRTNLKNYPSDETLIAFIHDPAAVHKGSKMPSWDGVIEPAEYAPLAQYVRTLAATTVAAAETH